MLATSGISILKGLQPGQEMTLTGQVIHVKAVKPEMPTIVKVEMTKTTPGSIDGIHINDYLEGQVYPLPEWLANGFYSMKVAKPYKEPEPELFENKEPAAAAVQDKKEPPEEAVEIEAKQLEESGEVEAKEDEKPQPTENKAIKPKANKQKQGTE